MPLPTLRALCSATFVLYPPSTSYYGESVPAGLSVDMPLNATALKYLTMEQAIADYAALIDHLKYTRPAAARPSTPLCVARSGNGLVRPSS